MGKENGVELIQVYTQSMEDLESNAADRYDSKSDKDHSDTFIQIQHISDRKNGHGAMGIDTESAYSKSEEAQQDDNSSDDPKKLIYGLRDNPPWYLTIIFALQQVSMSVPGSITVPLLVTDLICAGHLPHVRSDISSTFLVMCGISTLLQVTIGSRLPIIQGGTVTFVLPVISIMTLEKFRCPSPIQAVDGMSGNATDDEFWKIPMREVQGAIICSSLTEMFIGATGLLGILMRHVGPLTIMPTITLIGLTLFDLISDRCSTHWGIAITTAGCIILFSMHMESIRVPFPAYSKTRGCHVQYLQLFKLLPVILGIAIGWTLSAILTATGVLTDDPNSRQYNARADAHIESLYEANWIFIPYPGQWGLPTVSLASYLGMVAAMLSSVVESVGDYHACARICGTPPLPNHAVNRGITTEGLGGTLSGLFGSGGSTTSFSQCIGAIGFTKIASRSVWYCAAAVFIVSGIFGKLGAVLTMMPDCVLGGVMLVGLGMVTAIGVANLQYVDASSARNQCIVGVALMVGLSVPYWVDNNPNAINTGVTELDQSLQVLLGTSMFLGGVTAFILDNTIPGTAKERGLIAFRQTHDTKITENNTNDGHNDSDTKHDNHMSMTGSNEKKDSFSKTEESSYDVPFITKYLRKYHWTSYIPISPTYVTKEQDSSNGSGCTSCCTKQSKE